MIANVPSAAFLQGSALGAVLAVTFGSGDLTATAGAAVILIVIAFIFEKRAQKRMNTNTEASPQ
jgi:uncharacterized membrane protein YoaK (UPF0700 family)